MNPLLFEPIGLRNITLNNRIIIPPMTQYSATEGVAGDWHLMHLGHLAVSGAAMVFTESTYVDANARNNPSCLSLYTDEQAEALSRVIKFIHQNSDSKFCVQLCHAGRKAASKELWHNLEPMDEEDRYQTYAPSAIPIKEGWPTPKELSLTEIQQVIEYFQKAAIRADNAGADAIELHGAHGYLIHQFLSPLTNHRNDYYGGSMENRFRFGLELFEAVRSIWPADKPMGIRISATDWVDGGWNIDSSIKLARELDKLGCDFIHVSSGGNSPKQQITTGPGYQTSFAAAIREQVCMKVITVGQITNAHQAETILRLGAADIIGVARGALYNPRWVWQAAQDLDFDLTYPKQYEKAHPKLQLGNMP